MKRSRSTKKAGVCKIGKGDLASEVSDRYPHDYLKVLTLSTSERI